MINKENCIRFGTDGWRAIIADSFTFDNVQKVTQSIASYIKKQSRETLVTVGYDTRFLSNHFAETICKVLNENGVNAILSKSFLSTPALSSSVVDNKANGGIMVSASHNPPAFNGIKFKTNFGGSAPEYITKIFESSLSSPKRSSVCKGKTIKKDLTKVYLKRVSSFVDLKSIKKAKLNIVADPMYGAGIGYLNQLLKETNCNVINIHDYPDPLFGGLHPEPIESNLADLKNIVLKNSAAVGLATDGDADRIGVVDDLGRYLTPHQVFPLILYYLCKYKGLRGKIVQTISLGYLSERIAKDFNLEWEEVPVGFKYIAEKIMKENILVGGEESGGYGYGKYLPERDGILNSMMLIEMLAVTGKKLSFLLNEIEQKYGASVYLRTDFINPGIPKSEFVSLLKNKAPDKIAGLKVKQIKDYDGIEFVMEDDSWLLLRPSGTEPIIRVYSESNSSIKTKSIISWGEKVIKTLL